MTTHEFIFSDQRNHRITRHLVFWMVWWLSYTLLFHVPALELKGWGLNREAAPATFRDVQQVGAFIYGLKVLIFNSFLAVVIPQALLTYTLLYWLLPNFFYSKKNPLIISVIIIVILSVYRIIATWFTFFAPFGSYVFGLTDTLPTFSSSNTLGSWISLRQQVSSLPALLGITLMIKLVKRWRKKHQETEQLAKEKTAAELQLLKSQIHPHFLFNTLNNIYFFTLSNPDKAADMIGKLSTLLHYFLNECNQPFFLLEKEIKMIKDYVSLEKVRYGNEMTIDIEVQGDCKNKMVAPLLLIPFVENCFKHGASKMLDRPCVHIRIAVENGTLHFCISNNKPPISDSSKTIGKIGLRNVKKRLELLYPLNHELRIVEEPGSFTVFLKVLLSNYSVTAKDDETTQHLEKYEMA